MNYPNLERNLEICEKFAAQKKKDKAVLARHYNLSRPRIVKICQEVGKWKRLAEEADRRKAKKA